MCNAESGMGYAVLNTT